MSLYVVRCTKSLQSPLTCTCSWHERLLNLKLVTVRLWCWNVYVGVFGMINEDTHWPPSMNSLHIASVIISQFPIHQPIEALIKKIAKLLTRLAKVGHVSIWKPVWLTQTNPTYLPTITENNASQMLCDPLYQLPDCALQSVADDIPTICAWWSSSPSCPPRHQTS